MKRTLLFTLITLLLLGLTVSPALSGEPKQQSQFTTTNGESLEDGGIVHAILFWMDGCPHCHDVLDNVLPPLEEKYGTQLEITLVEISTREDIEGLYETAAAYDIPKERVGVPFLIIGDKVLIGSGQIPAELPGLIESYLAAGGVALPEIPAIQSFLEEEPGGEEDCSTTANCGTPTPTAADVSADSTKNPDRSPTPVPSPTPIPAASTNEPPPGDGFVLAIGTLVLMTGALIFSLISVLSGKTFSLPPWTDWLIPGLIIIGIGVAGYLSYVETQLVEAVCGPVGDCNTVQSSPYAYLFGVLPVGVLGLGGYLALLAVWVVRRLQTQWAHLANIIFWIFGIFAVAFSLYLTYLEPFVIHAVCMWCLSSAVIVTLLLLLGTPKAARSLSSLKRKQS
ncbi:MAG: vitamin K epoxide reductase family protein [Anaerolineales bacterium]|nr:vitamin K epoxide reductase family protein [Anaerolineales bacterium]